MKVPVSVFVLTTSLSITLKNEHMQMLAIWCAVISGFVVANQLRREYPVAADAAGMVVVLGFCGTAFHVVLAILGVF